jgi:hypothetical protein
MTFMPKFSPAFATAPAKLHEMPDRRRAATPALGMNRNRLVTSTVPRAVTSPPARMRRAYESLLTDLEHE